MIAYPSYSGMRKNGFFSLPEGFEFPPIYRKPKTALKPKRKTRSGKRGPRKTFRPQFGNLTALLYSLQEQLMGFDGDVGRPNVDVARSCARMVLYGSTPESFRYTDKRLVRDIGTVLERLSQ